MSDGQTPVLQGGNQKSNRKIRKIHIINISSKFYKARLYREHVVQNKLSLWQNKEKNKIMFRRTRSLSNAICNNHKIFLSEYIDDL